MLKWIEKEKKEEGRFYGDKRTFRAGESRRDRT